MLGCLLIGCGARTDLDVVCTEADDGADEPPAHCSTFEVGEAHVALTTQGAVNSLALDARRGEVLVVATTWWRGTVTLGAALTQGDGSGR